jgi:LmbE family N-acetylglucosaminyl deacetylase
MVTAIEGAGTSEDTWRDWAAVAGWPALRLDPATPPLVVAPHPDDEVLGAGGLLAMLAAAEVVVVTGGEASHPGSRVYHPDQLAAIRRDETAEALRRLGLPETSVRHLGQPDGEVDEAALTAHLAERLAPGRWCLATWRGDGHPDHEAVGRAAAAACAATGAILLEYPIWTWHWAHPGDERVPWDRARRLGLTDAARHAKEQAILAFPSQIEDLGPDPADAAILPPHVLARFRRPYEVVFS